MSHLKKLFMYVAGTLVILVGIAGCFLPVIPGVALILVGLTMMGKEAILLEPLQRWIKKIKDARNTSEKKNP